MSKSAMGDGYSLGNESPLDRNGLNLPDRLDLIGKLAAHSRLVLLDMIHEAQSGHLGSSLSCVDIISVLKFDQMNWTATSPGRQDSDVFVLSKGHAAPAWYAALIVSGDISEDEAHSLRRIDSRLQGHPDRKRLELVDVSTGALGQGLSIALGRAEAKRLKGHPFNVYCVLGDGELQEGQIWEAMMYAGAHGLPNVIVVIDHNKSQNDGNLEEIVSVFPLTDKLRSFHWHVQEVDGHSHLSIRDAVINAKANSRQPSAIIAHTRKGYLGRDRILLNGAHSGTLSEEDYKQAVEHLKVAL